MARRHAAQATAIGLLVGLTSAVGGPTGAVAAAPEGAARVQLSNDGDGVAAATVPVTTAAAASGATARRTTDAVVTIESDTFAQVAVTWRGEAGAVEVQTRSGGSWSGWRELEEIHDAPDPGTEGNGLHGSDLLWVGDADAVRVRTDGAAPRDLSVVLQRPAAAAAATTPARGADAAGRAKAAAGDAAESDDAAPKKAKKAGVPKPNLLTRKQWGANNKWRNGSPTYTSNLKQVHIHHSATANGYTKAEVPGLIQGMYRYHTKSLGWFDLGYNFVVDRFGRIWKGRSGGAGKLVRGAHTLGFNEGSFGIAVLGNYESVKPTKKAIKAVARLSAWKIDKHGAPKARGKVKVVSAGSDRYPKGTTVRLPAMDGHRDTNQTACPGQLLYDRLPAIRKRTQKRLDRFRA